jgi:hypothetical protein
MRSEKLRNAIDGICWNLIETKERKMSKRNAAKIGHDDGLVVGQLIRSRFENKAEYMVACFEAEEIGRLYSPFEFLAKELNDSRDPDASWASYEAGLRVGFNKAWRERA